MTYRIGIIGGDGIGPEVVAQAVKCLDATGVSYEPTTFDLGWERYERDGTILPDEDLEAVRKLDAVLLGAVGAAAGKGAGIVERGILLRMRFELDLYVNHPPVRRRARRPPSRHRPRRHPREHRGCLRGRGRVPAEGHAARSCHAGLGEHAHGRRAVHSVRVRARAVASAQAPHARAQDECAHVRGRSVAARLRRRGPRVPRRDHRVQPRRRNVHLLRAGSGSLRRDRHRQHVRRHHHRPRRRDRRWDRAVGLGQPQPGAHRPVAVRAGPRVGARHRGHRKGRSAPRSCRPR